MMTLMDLKKPTKETHHFSQSICMHLGAPCPALSRMLAALAGAVDKARPVTTPDFELCGESLLDGCARHCPARFIATHDRIRVYCDVEAATDSKALELFADSLFQPDAQGFSGTQLDHRPCAMGQAIPRLPHHRPDVPVSHPAL